MGSFSGGWGWGPGCRSGGKGGGDCNRLRMGSLPAWVPTGPALDMLKDIKEGLVTLHVAFNHVANE